MTLWEERKFARSLELLRLRGLVSELTEKLREQENTFEERVNNLLCRCREVNFAVEFAIKVNSVKKGVLSSRWRDEFNAV
ncbi:hypothetical protein Q1695_015295 [Nippostrongylus brasiliensis]|nr:hypothetical protein Q1695_015295 [Nippostrongylus brasiliensis]